MVIINGHVRQKLHFLAYVKMLNPIFLYLGTGLERHTKKLQPKLNVERCAWYTIN